VFYKQTNSDDVIQLAQEKARSFFPELKMFTLTNVFIAIWHLLDRGRLLGKHPVVQHVIRVHVLNGM